VEAVSFGALFLLALLGPAFVAGAPAMTKADDQDAWVLIVGVIGAAGVGALLQLTGRALWEFLSPLSPQGGWRRFSTRKNDFRAEIARSKPQEGYWGLAGPTEGPFVGDDKVPPLGAAEKPWSYGQRVVVTAEYFLYSEAPDGLLQWIRRRYLRFVDAVSAAAAIFLGIGFGCFLPGQDPVRMAVLDAVLVLVAGATFLFANESRRAAQQMETFWYKVREHDKNLQKPPVTLAFAPKTELLVRPNGGVE